MEPLKQLAINTARDHIKNYLENGLAINSEPIHTFFDYPLSDDQEVSLRDWLNDCDLLPLRSEFKTVESWEQSVHFEVQDYHDEYVKELVNYGITTELLENMRKLYDELETKKDYYAYKINKLWNEKNTESTE